MLLSREVDTRSAAYQALFEQTEPLGRLLGQGIGTRIYAIQGTDYVVKIRAITCPAPLVAGERLPEPIEITYDGLTISHGEKAIPYPYDQQACRLALHHAVIERGMLDYTREKAREGQKALDHIVRNEGDYFVMDDGVLYHLLVQKRALGETLFKDRLTEYSAAQVILQMGAVMDFFDRIGLMHRDIKPQNVHFREEEKPSRGHTLLYDFDNAKLLFETRETMTDLVLRTIFELQEGMHEGMAIGTPPYMTPEQARGSTDLRSDVFSLGLSLAEALTATVMNTGRSPDELLERVAFSPQKIRDHALRLMRSAAVDDGLVDGIGFMLEEKSQDRLIEPARQAAIRILLETGWREEEIQPYLPGSRGIEGRYVG